MKQHESHVVFKTRFHRQTIKTLEHLASARVSSMDANWEQAQQGVIYIVEKRTCTIFIHKTLEISNREITTKSPMQYHNIVMK